MLIAQAVFLLERRHRDKQTDASERYNHAGGYAGMGSDTDKILNTRMPSVL